MSIGMSSTPAMVTCTTWRRPSESRAARGLADAGEGAREVGVVLRRDEPVERHDRQRRVATRLVAAVAVGAAGGGQRVDHLLHAERPGRELADLPAFTLPALPMPLR